MTNNQTQLFIKSINVANPDKIKVAWIEQRDGVESKHTIESNKEPAEELFKALNSLASEAIKAAGVEWDIDTTKVEGIVLRTPEAQKESGLKVTIRGVIGDGNPTQPITIPFREPKKYGAAVPEMLEKICNQGKQYIQAERNEQASFAPGSVIYRGGIPDERSFADLEAEPDQQTKPNWEAA
jgi:hypothetical protein